MFKVLSAALCTQMLVTPAQSVKIQSDAPEYSLVGEWFSSCVKDSCLAWKTGSAREDARAVVMASYFVANSPRLLLRMPMLDTNEEIVMTLDGAEWLTLKPLYCIAENCFALTPPLDRSTLVRLGLTQTLGVRIRLEASDGPSLIEIGLGGFKGVVDKVR